MNYLKSLIGYESKLKCINCHNSSEKSHFSTSCENKCQICTLCIKNLKRNNSICPNPKCSGKLIRSDFEYIENTEVDSFQNNKINQILTVDSLIFSQNFNEFDTLKNSSIFSECVSPIAYEQSPWSNELTEYFPNNLLNVETKSSEIVKNKENKDIQINTLPSKAKLLNCPFCNNPKDVKNESELVRCLSIYCKGKNYFCKLCNQGVELIQQSTHYPKGLWMGMCIRSSNEKLSKLK
jgi:hypothetical protein